MKAATVNACMEPELKNDAEAILHRVGLTSAEAIRLFYRQICLYQGLPFAAGIPNETTLTAMRDADAGNTHRAKSVDALFDELDGEC